MIGSHGPAAAEAVPALRSARRSVAEAPDDRRANAGKHGKGGTTRLPRVASLLGADQAEVREAAASALGSLELDAKTIRPHLAKALRDDKSEACAESP